MIKNVYKVGGGVTSPALIYRVESYTEVMVGNMRTPLHVLLGAVLLLLAIGAANVANLMLEAGLARRREMAIHMSLGASLRRLVGMLVAEGVCLAVAAGVLAVVIFRWIVSAFVGLAGNQLPRASTIHLDGRVLAFSAAVTLAVGIAYSLFPVVLLREPEPSASVREGDVRGGSRSGSFTRRALVVAEIALAFALLVSSALLLKKLVLLRSRDSGLRTEPNCRLPSRLERSPLRERYGGQGILPSPVRRAEGGSRPVRETSFSN